MDNLTDNREYDWVSFTRRTNEPKLNWLEAQLSALQIPNRRHGDSFHAPVLQVPRSYLNDAWSVLVQPVGQLFVGKNPDITFDDLPDDHFIFESWLGEKPQRVELEDNEDATRFKGEAVQLPGYAARMIFVDVNSSNLSAMAFNPRGNESPDADWEVLARFKGGGIYRYSPVETEAISDLQIEIKKAARAEPDASVGSIFHHVIKSRADAGSIECHKLEGDVWILVPPKAQRTQVMKERYKN